MADAFIKIYRKMLDWEWYRDTNTFALFLHCLLIANWKDGRFMGVEIPRGSFVSSYPQLAQQTNMSVQNVRTAVNHLKSTGELTVKSHAKFSVFTVVKYNDYQDANSQLTDNQQATNRQLTTIEEIKNKRNKDIEKETYISKDIYAKKEKNIIPPTVEMVRSYCQERNNGIDPEAFVNFYESKGWMIGKNKMKDWQSAVRTWEKSRKGNNNNDTLARRDGEDEKQHNAELDEHIRRIEAGEFDAEDEELRRMWD